MGRPALEQPRRVRVTCYLTDELRDVLREMADRECRSMTSMMGKLASDLLRAEKAKEESRR
jgi:hypothetical protein